MNELNTFYENIRNWCMDNQTLAIAIAAGAAILIIAILIIRSVHKENELFRQEEAKKAAEAQGETPAETIEEQLVGAGLIPETEAETVPSEEAIPEDEAQAENAAEVIPEISEEAQLLDLPEPKIILIGQETEAQTENETSVETEAGAEETFGSTDFAGPEDGSLSSFEATREAAREAAREHGPEELETLLREGNEGYQAKITADSAAENFLQNVNAEISKVPAKNVESIEITLEKAHITIHYAGDKNKRYPAVDVSGEFVPSEEKIPDMGAMDAPVETDIFGRPIRKKYGAENRNVSRSGRRYTEEELDSQIK